MLTLFQKRQEEQDSKSASSEPKHEKSKSAEKHLYLEQKIVAMQKALLNSPFKRPFEQTFNVGKTS